jgi:hypothetical protein
MKKIKQIVPRQILLLDPEIHAPYISATDAARLTRIGETAVRSLELRRFGKRIYVKVSHFNDFILNGEEATENARK